MNAENRQRDTFAWSCAHRDVKVRRKIHLFRPNGKTNRDDILKSKTAASVELQRVLAHKTHM